MKAIACIKTNCLKSKICKYILILRNLGLYSLCILQFCIVSRNSILPKHLPALKLTLVVFLGVRVGFKYFSLGSFSKWVLTHSSPGRIDFIFQRKFLNIFQMKKLYFNINVYVFLSTQKTKIYIRDIIAGYIIGIHFLQL